MFTDDAGIIALCGSVVQFTLGVIPCWETVTDTLEARVVSRGGTPTDYVLKDAIASFIWLPMIVAAPFANDLEGELHPNTRKNLYRNPILKMQQDGFLPPANNLQNVHKK